ncbi:hypothetical protein E2C01_006552 [Portunus trituberculatus]|uniref:Uncharacterized protein n=1 Tax=Portunus trituberculatus TaxID=210409 RepID=A0A5B7CXM9_PORTR|nr:hypothetical protein [Portunus trituberculatus]
MNRRKPDKKDHKISATTNPAQNNIDSVSESTEDINGDRNEPETSNAGGFIIFLVNENRRRCPVMLKSKNIRRIVKPTQAAETLALLDVAESAYVPKSDASLSDDHKCLDTSLNFFYINFCNIHGLRSNFQCVEHHLSSTKPHLRFLTETELSQATVTSYFLYSHFRSKAGCCVYGLDPRRLEPSLVE